MTRNSPLTLPAVLDMTHGAELKRELLTTAVIDGSEVQRIASPILQLLAAAVAGGTRFTSASEALRQAAAKLGLTTALNFPGAE